MYIKLKGEGGRGGSTLSVENKVLVEIYIDIVKYLDNKGWEEDKTPIIVYLISALHLICKK